TGTRIVSNTPSSKPSTSMMPLSVSTESNTSPRFTITPGCACHSTRVAASISAPNEGKRNSGMINYFLFGQGLFDGSHNRGHLWQGGLFHVFGIGNGYLHRTHSHQRSIQIVKSLLRNTHTDLGTQTATAPTFVHHHSTMGLAHRSQNGFIIERPQTTQVNHFRLDTTACQFFRRCQCLVQTAAI